MSILDFGLRYVLRFFIVQKVRIITKNLRALNLELFSLPLKLDVHISVN